MFPPLEPFATGHLPVSDGHELYWEASGNPDGRAALYLHGGPGGGIKVGYRRYFDPQTFLIVSFEQRGCGRSRPLVTEPDADLSTNHTQALIADIEALRDHLNVDTWLLLGVSWGVTLALAYAQTHPMRVTGIVLAAINTTTRAEVEWVTEQMRHFFPQQWEQFVASSGRKSGQRIIDAYHDRIRDPDPEVRRLAAEAWCAWENVHVSLDPNFTPNNDFKDPVFRMQFATLVIHYWCHAGFLDDGTLQANMVRLANIPGVLIHGRFDVSSPLLTAWNLHQAWPDSKLLIIESEGHGGQKMFEEVTRAIARLSESQKNKP